MDASVFSIKYHVFRDFCHSTNMNFYVWKATFSTEVHLNSAHHLCNARHRGELCIIYLDFFFLLWSIKIKTKYTKRGKNKLNNEETFCWRHVRMLFIIGSGVALRSSIIPSIYRALFGVERTEMKSSLHSWVKYCDGRRFCTIFSLKNRQCCQFLKFLIFSISD